MAAIRSRRLARCAGCGITDALCICSMLVPVAVRTHVVIVAHRNEITKTSNTGRLAARLLEGAELHVRGVDASERTLVGEESVATTRRLVLFPAPGARMLTSDDARGEPYVLVVPDGSWSQARKLARRDPRAAGAEPVTLPPGDASRYGLRRNEREGGLCTIEAVARALSILEGERGDEVEAHLLTVFDTFVARQQSIRRNRLTPPT